MSNRLFKCKYPTKQNRTCWQWCANGCNNSQQGKNVTHKSLQSMRNERAWPQQCWKSCANGSNIIALRFGDHGTKEMLRVVGWKVWPVSDCAATSNNMQQGVQRDATCTRGLRSWKAATQRSPVTSKKRLRGRLKAAVQRFVYFNNMARKHTFNGLFQRLSNAPTKQWI